MSVQRVTFHIFIQSLFILVRKLNKHKNKHFNFFKLSGSVNVIFDDLGFLDFRPSAECGVVYLSESELIGGNSYKQRIIKLAKVGD